MPTGAIEHRDDPIIGAGLRNLIEKELNKLPLVLLDAPKRPMVYRSTR